MQKEELRQLLGKYRLRPRKDLGQHYLLDDNILRTIIEAAEIEQNEPVLEIGAGPGILTKELARAGAEVLAVEYDRAFCRLLQEEFHNWRNVHVLCEDALRLDFTKLDSNQEKVGNPPELVARSEVTGAPMSNFLAKGIPSTEATPGLSVRLQATFAQKARQLNNTNVIPSDSKAMVGANFQSSKKINKLVANIPYQITNPLLRRILDPRSTIDTAILLMQKEVAERLLAPPGSSERGILTLMVEKYGTIKKIIDVPAASFWPEPKVTSSLVKITRVENLQAKIENLVQNPMTDSKLSNSRFKPPEIDNAFFWLIKQGFSGKRKTLINSLSGSLRLPKPTVTAIVEASGIKLSNRAEDLTLKEWERLFSEYQKLVSGF